MRNKPDAGAHVEGIDSVMNLALFGAAKDTTHGIWHLNQLT